MGQGSIIGYEINEKTCQISFYNDKEMEPQTLEVDSDNFQIPFMIAFISHPAFLFLQTA